MFQKISKLIYTDNYPFLVDMKEVLNVIICHPTLDQYTAFNFPLHDISELTPAHLRSLHEFEQLYERY